MTDKVVARAEVAALGERLRKAGRKIVFANGCFDLFHVGHVRYLEGARQQGDVLVVGVNSDRTVRLLKGEGRPLLPEEARAELLAAMECVDYVVIFDDATAANILRDLQPDVHCKGTDYTEATVPEREVVQSWGGRVVIAGDPKDHSTRDVLARIARQNKVEK
ncbi:MAG: D-glycero-beta-D-manno-heptose 1-phosphate adenylyltransferase [Acidobacteria bacterium]|nr:MAG: D-glycero-beta-D-manno-heptose 1-phosphate adenylyltransferase [Acidobacteriota bacterium]